MHKIELEDLAATETFSLREKVVLLTGATGGTGLAIARALARHGAFVFASGRDEGRLSALVSELNQKASGAKGAAADLLQPGTPDFLVKQAVGWKGRLDALVLCAGGARCTFFERLTKAEFDAALRLNLTANVDLVRESLPHLQKQKRGWIVCVNTIASREPAPPRGTAYLSAKVGLRYFADGLFSEIRDKGISVTSILPDLTDTPMVPESLNYDRSTLIRPESVARAVLYAFSNDPDVCITEIHLRPQPSLRRLKQGAGHGKA
jgi:NADP-dependent 3-hydroxy acid dehydrogenase YdfG